MNKKSVNKVKLKFPSRKNFLIVGSGDPVKTFIKKLAKYFPDSPILVLSDKECDQAWSICEKEPIEKVARENNLKLEFIDDINNKEIINKIVKASCNICFVLGSRWIFKKEFIDIFKGMIFNYHTSDLPNYQGGGGYRWQIMNQEKNIFIAFHQLTAEIDSGPILAVAKKKLKEKNEINPKDIFAGLQAFTIEYFDIFLKKLKQMKAARLIKQEQAGAAYFPLLDNEINGAIDLAWGVKDVKLFIAAFSYPYKGAFLFYKDKKIFIKEAEISGRREKFHPFTAGLIINKTEKLLEVPGSGGCILLGELSDENNKKLPMADFRLGDRFYMPPEKLLLAKIHRPSNKKFILQVSEKKYADGAKNLLIINGTKRSKSNKRHKI